MKTESSLTKCCTVPWSEDTLNLPHNSPLFISLKSSSQRAASLEQTQSLGWEPKMFFDVCVLIVCVCLYARACDRCFEHPEGMCL